MIYCSLSIPTGPSPPPSPRPSCPTSSPSSSLPSISSPPSPPPSPPSPRNAVSYNGRIYSTLSDVPVDGGDQLCQNGYISLPSGYTVAPDNADSIAVIAAHTWSTDVVIVASGNAYGVSRFSNGTQYGSGGLLSQNGSSYLSNLCFGEVLIMLIPGSFRHDQ